MTFLESKGMIECRSLVATAAAGGMHSNLLPIPEVTSGLRLNIRRHAVQAADDPMSMLPSSPAPPPSKKQMRLSFRDVLFGFQSQSIERKFRNWCDQDPVSVTNRWMVLAVAVAWLVRSVPELQRMWSSMEDTVTFVMLNHAVHAAFMLLDLLPRLYSFKALIHWLARTEIGRKFGGARWDSSQSRQVLAVIAAAAQLVLVLMQWLGSAMPMLPQRWPTTPAARHGMAAAFMIYRAVLPTISAQPLMLQEYAPVALLSATNNSLLMAHTLSSVSIRPGGYMAVIAACVAEQVVSLVLSAGLIWRARSRFLAQKEMA
jgi:hypothetical protein